MVKSVYVHAQSIHLVKSMSLCFVVASERQQTWCWVGNAKSVEWIFSALVIVCTSIIQDIAGKNNLVIRIRTLVFLHLD